MTAKYHTPSPNEYEQEELKERLVATLFPMIQQKQNKVAVEFFKKHPETLLIYSNSRQSLLHVAVEAKNYEMMDFLLRSVPKKVRMSNGSTLIDCQNAEGDSALMQAIKSEDLKATRIILKYCPSFDITEYETTKKATHLAAETGNVDIMRTVLYAKWKMKKALKIDEPVEKTGFTPLHFAAKAGKLDMVEYLIRQKADINKKTTQAGRTALMLAAGNNQMKVFNYLSSLPQTNKDLADKYGKKIDYFLDPKNRLNESEDAFEKLVEETAYMEEAEAEKILNQFLEERNECPVIIEARKYGPVIRKKSECPVIVEARKYGLDNPKVKE